MMGELNNKYIELERKINQARLQDCFIINSSNGKQNPYETQRQNVIDKYFNGNFNEEARKHLLDIFEQINEHLAMILGI